MNQLTSPNIPKRAPTRSTSSIANDIFFAQLPLMFVVAGVTIFLSIFGNYWLHPLLISIVTGAIYALVPFGAHSYVLSDEQNVGFKAVIKSSLTTLLFFIFIGLLTSVILSFIIPTIGQTILVHLAPPPTPTKFFLVVAGMVLLGILFFSLFGTMFPAVVDRGDINPITAATRGTARAVFWRLTVVAVLSAIIGFILIRGLGPIFARIVLELENLVLVSAVMGLPITFFMFMISTIAAVIFSKAYLGSYSGGKTAQDRAEHT